MKDTIVTARRKKTELITLLICFVVSNLLHLYAIIAYHAPFTETPGYAMTLRKPAGNWMREKDKRMSQSVRRWKHG